jgi:hypothetical protein
MYHTLKTWPPYFQDIVSRKKTFEVRKHDRDFKEGDWLLLREWCPVDLKYTGRQVGYVISYVLEGGDFGIAPDYCVIGFWQQILIDGLDLDNELDRMTSLRNLRKKEANDAVA